MRSVDNPGPNLNSLVEGLQEVATVFETSVVWVCKNGNVCMELVNTGILVTPCFDTDGDVEDVTLGFNMDAFETLYPEDPGKYTPTALIINRTWKSVTDALVAVSGLLAMLETWNGNNQVLLRACKAHHDA